MFFKCRAFIKRRKIHNNRYKETTLEASQIHLSLLIRSRGVAPSHSLHTNTLCIGLHACQLTPTQPCMPEISFKDTGRTSSCMKREKERHLFRLPSCISSRKMGARCFLYECVLYSSEKILQTKVKNCRRLIYDAFYFTAEFARFR